MQSNLIRQLAVAVPLIFSPAAGYADSFTAGTVMEKMKSEERYTFVSGMIEAFAIARYMQDKKKPDGMNCIYDWFYKNPKTIENIYTAFERFTDYPPGSVVDAMIRKACT